MDDYELPPSNITLVNMIAGACSGIFENCLFYPLDTAKVGSDSEQGKAFIRGIHEMTRIQDFSEKNIKLKKGTVGVLLQMMKEEGLTSPYKGFGITVLGSAPSHAVYYGSYEYTKSYLSNYSNNSIIFGLAGIIATITHDAIMIPAETVKQRMQLENSPYKKISDCISKVYKAEGIRAFYRSYGTQLLMNIPFQSSHFMIYEVTSNFMDPKRSYNPLVHVTAGGIAGGAAAAITTPLDVCKTLLQTQTYKSRVVGIKNAIKTVYEVAGLPGFFRGVTARVIFTMPSTAICWGVYESMRVALRT